MNKNTTGNINKKNNKNTTSKISNSIKNSIKSEIVSSSPSPPETASSHLSSASATTSTLMEPSKMTSNPAVNTGSSGSTDFVKKLFQMLESDEY